MLRYHWWNSMYRLGNECVSLSVYIELFSTNFPKKTFSSQRKARVENFFSYFIEKKTKNKVFHLFNVLSMKKMIFYVLLTLNCELGVLKNILQTHWMTSHLLHSSGWFSFSYFCTKILLLQGFCIILIARLSHTFTLKWFLSFLIQDEKTQEKREKRKIALNERGWRHWSSTVGDLNFNEYF